MSRYAIIVAGGSGSRFGLNTPKQFLPLCGKPVLMHTIDKFAALGDVAIIVVLPQSFVDWWNDLCAEHGFATPHSVVVGGQNRFCSVKNAIVTIDAQPGDTIAVHDGVRPLVSTALIEAAYCCAEAKGNAIPVVHVTDSVRQVVDDCCHSVPLNRDSLRAVQTPQVFDAVALRNAYDADYSPFYTDDASVLEHNGGVINLIDGEVTNIKITHPNDLTIAEMLMCR
ncbi:MAG: 2-C-methyl-D-erythritol 4-phosphate cytidylyltransferase [Muribaculaceae bacterium]